MKFIGLVIKNRFIVIYIYSYHDFKKNKLLLFRGRLKVYDFIMMKLFFIYMELSNSCMRFRYSHIE